MKKKITWCSSCLNMSTRPRISFDENGSCNACSWSKEKKSIDWSKRINLLEEILNKHRTNDGSFDCLVPVSGGKDGSHVAYNLKHKYGMNPLAVTIRPALELELGDKNLENFRNSGYDHMHISPNPKAMQFLNKMGFIEKGFPYYGWLIAIQAAPLQVAKNYGLGIVFYGEDGEIEYGGSKETIDNPLYTIDYQKRVYLEGGYDKVLNLVENKGMNTSFFRFPELQNDNELSITHWSYFENWNPYNNYITAKTHCGLEESEDTNQGTFTNFAQNDQALYCLHTYLMYLKFGFGRATQDAGIEIRRGSMTRDQGLNLVRMYDNFYPEPFIEMYLDYYEMTKKEFDAVLDRWVNIDLFEKINGIWSPKFEVGIDFEYEDRNS